MLAMWLGAMLAIKFFVAPWIVAEFGWIGVVLSVLALLAIAKVMDRRHASDC